MPRHGGTNPACNPLTFLPERREGRSAHGKSKMAVHFVADLNFNADSARYALPRGIPDTTELVRRICEVWRSRVAEDDSVWILGNVGNPVHLAGLPGTKHLVRAAGDPQPWNCLATGRYACVSERQWLETPHGNLLLVNDPAKAGETEALVLHGRAHGDWRRPGYLSVTAAMHGWGPVSLDEIARRSFDPEPPSILSRAA